jgi:competence protein ComEC
MKGRVWVFINEMVAGLRQGEDTRLYGWISPFEPPRNPGQFDMARHMSLRKISAKINLKSRLQCLRKPLTRLPWYAHLIRIIRHRTRRAVLNKKFFTNRERGLLEALLLGDRHHIGARTFLAFQKTGLLHLISLSGMHLGILAGSVWWVCKTAGLLKPGRSVTCALVVGLFLLIVPPRAATIRAAIIVWVFCAASCLHRRTVPFNSLSLAALITLLWRPTQLFEAGWQLSFTCVSGLLLLTPLQQRALFRNNKTSLRVLLSGLRNKTGMLLYAGTGAWLGGAGILCYHFHTITPLAVIWTLLTLPLLGPILILGFMHMMLGALFLPLGHLLKGVLCLLTRILIHMVHCFADLDLGLFVIGRISIMAVILYYLLLLSFLWPWGAHQYLKRGFQVLTLCGLASILGLTKWHHTHYHDLVLTCLDVGHGQAVVLQSPPHTNWIFDAGSLYHNDIGRHVVNPFLDERGIGRIHALFMSHPDMDHISGIPSLVYYRKPEQVVMDTKWLITGDDQPYMFHQLLNTLDAFHVPVTAFDPNTQESMPVSLQRLWPHTSENGFLDLSDNNRSSVFLLSFAQRTILMCADIEQFAQEQLMHLYPDLKADVVVAPHHGSLKTLESGFLEQLDPEIVLCSCGRSQYRTGQVIKDYRGTRMYATASHGAVSLRIHKTGHITVSMNNQE